MTLPLPADLSGPTRPATVDARLTAAADACRLLGVLFVLLGGLPLLPVVGFWGPVGFRGSMFSMMGRALGVAATLVLVGPGVWYFVASRLIRRAEVKAATVSLYVVCAQAALIIIGLLLSWLPVGIPSILGLFFLPALAATAVQLFRARRVAASTALGAAFDLLPPRPVLPIESQE